MPDADALDLRAALAHRQLCLFFQPAVSHTGTIVGAEALVRWRHPAHGLLGADVVLARAEEQDLVDELGDWVVRNAIRHRAAWPAELFVAINASPAQLASPRIVEVLEAACARHGVDPADVWLEVTEDAPLTLPATGAALQGLRDRGVRIALDDFGAGYATFERLREFAFDVCKIDRSFVSGLGRNRTDDTLLRSVVEAAHAFGATVVAEGVERPEQWERVRWLGCDLAQGYHLYRPMPAEQLRLLLRDGAPPPAPAAATVAAGPPVPAGHRLALHADDHHLGELVAHFLRPALDHPTGTAVIIATTAHVASIAGALAVAGADLRQDRAHGRLVFLDATTLVDEVSRHGLVDAERTRTTFAALAGRLGAGRGTGPVRIYGELAPLAWQRGDIAGISVIEQEGDRLCQSLSDTELLCGYPMGDFDGHADVSSLAALCARHHRAAEGLDGPEDHLRALFELLRQQVSCSATLAAELDAWREREQSREHRTGPAVHEARNAAAIALTALESIRRSSAAGSGVDDLAGRASVALTRIERALHLLEGTAGTGGRSADREGAGPVGQLSRSAARPAGSSP